MSERICTIEGCGRKHEARGLCGKHYQRLKASPDFGKPGCSVDSCDSLSWSRGWCHAHYQRWQKYGNPTGQPAKRQRPECAIEGCSKLNSSRGLCSTHLARLNRVGSTDDYVPVIERFELFIHKAEPDHCWEWLGHRNNKGYGKIGLLYAHRVACERAHGAPPSVDSVAMHSCDNPPCVNPRHLSWGSQSDNMADMHSKGRHNRKRAS